MEYHEAVTTLFGLRRYPPHPGTETTAALLSTLGDPHEGTTFVQVAGSNGKGTTARMVESVLAEAGLTVGLYTSPHFDDLRERIRVDGRSISRSAVASFVDRVEDHLSGAAASDDSPVTFFEAMTAMALWEFDRQEVDVAVLEVGIGGAYDATSVVDPVASAVTSVTLEHTDYLGDTVEEIARDKAQVVPDDGPLVTAATGPALSAIRDVAGDAVVTVGDGQEADVTARYGGGVSRGEAAVTVEAADWRVEARIPTLGAHQARNAGIAAVLARAGARAVGADLPSGTIADGLRGAHWPGRFEVMGDDPLVVLDGAHNPGACRALADTLSSFEYDDLHLVFGAMVDKDHDEMAAALPGPTTVRTCRPQIDRAEHESVLSGVFEDAGVPPGAVEERRDVAGAVEAALADASPGDCVLVTGSLHAVGEARDRWTRRYVRPRVDDRDDARAVLSRSNVPADDPTASPGDLARETVATRVRPRQVGPLRAAALSAGLAPATAGIEDDEEPIEVVLSGSVADFERLVDRLADRDSGLAAIASDLRATLGLDGERPVGPRAASDESGASWPWDEGTAVMGILNVTPDSFHDGGEYDTVDAARRRAERMVDAGVDVLDVGGESTRPGADPVPVEEEIDRVVPTIEAIGDLGATVSVDTRKAPVAEAAVEAGADVINDVSGLADPEMRFVAAEYDAGLVVMHSVDAPVVPGRNVEYDDVVEDVMAALRERVLLAERAGVPRDRIVVDPGLGFGKSAAESFELLDRIGEFRALGCPVMVGHSHKSMFELVDRGPDERFSPTVAASALAADRGADVIRVHDGPENVAAIKTALAVGDPRRFE